MPDVDRVDARGATLQQHVGEPAGRGPDVERDAAGRVDPEAIQPVRELDAAPRNPGMVAALDA